MARIPLGSFGNAIAQPAPAVRIPAGAFDNGGAGMQKLGETLAGIGNDMAAEQKRVDEKVALVTAHGSVQTGLADLSDAMVRGISDGSIPRDGADATFASEAQKLVKDQTKGLDPNMQRVVLADSISIVGRYTNGVRDAAVKRGQQDTRAGLFSYIADMQHLAMTDRDKATSQAMTAIDGLGPHAGLDPVAIFETKKKTREGIAYANALRMVSGSRNDLAGIESSLQALDSPAFADLDPKQGEILRSSLLTHRLRLENKLDTFALRREARAEKAIGKMDQQIASGIPATPEMWSGWANEIKGTAQEEAFQERIKEEELTQRLLREPLDRQVSFLQAREASLMQDGGTVRDRANLDRLRRVVEAGKKQLEEAPLLFAQNRTGEAVKPLDLNMLMDPARQQELSSMFADRTATLAAMQKQYGPMVKPRVLLPLEAETLTKILNQTAPDQQVELFRSIRLAVGDDASYQGALAQIAPDSPVKAMAGTLAARGVDYVQAHAFSADQTIAARQTAQFALLGESLLNPSKARKAADGSARTWVMPKRGDMLRRFGDKVGDTFSGTPEAMDSQFEFVQATYAGMMASRGAGKNPEVVDSALFDQAIERTTPVMKQGGVSFLKPIVGMSDDQFRENLHAEARQIHFNGPESYLAYHAKYGRGNVFDALKGHVSMMARDIGLLENWGPNPDHLFNYFHDVAAKEGGKDIIWHGVLPVTTKQLPDIQRPLAAGGACRQCRRGAFPRYQGQGGDRRQVHGDGLSIAARSHDSGHERQVHQGPGNLSRYDPAKAERRLILSTKL